MTQTAPLREDIIDAVFRPAIAFFVGLVLGYTTQLADSTGWPIAIVFTAVLAIAVLIWIWAYEWLRKVSDWLFEKIGLGAGLKPQLVAPPKRRKHWFVRYGWIVGLLAGFLGVLFFPEWMPI